MTELTVEYNIGNLEIGVNKGKERGRREYRVTIVESS